MNFLKHFFTSKSIGTLHEPCIPTTFRNGKWIFNRKTSYWSDFVDRKQSRRNGESSLTHQERERKKEKRKMEFDFCERKTWKIKRMDGKEQ